MREGSWKRVPLDEVLAYVEEQEPGLHRPDSALDRLTEIDERQGLVLCFGSLPGFRRRGRPGTRCLGGDRGGRLAVCPCLARDQLEGVDR